MLAVSCTCLPSSIHVHVCASIGDLSTTKTFAPPLNPLPSHNLRSPNLKPAMESMETSGVWTLQPDTDQTKLDVFSWSTLKSFALASGNPYDSIELR